jgi:hypothetical protein
MNGNPLPYPHCLTIIIQRPINFTITIIYYYVNNNNEEPIYVFLTLLGNSMEILWKFYVFCAILLFYTKIIIDRVIFETFF